MIKNILVLFLCYSNNMGKIVQVFQYYDILLSIKKDIDQTGPGVRY